jgi:hypothetical protein
MSIVILLSHFHLRPYFNTFSLFLLIVKAEMTSCHFNEKLSSLSGTIILGLVLDCRIAGTTVLYIGRLFGQVLYVQLLLGGGGVWDGNPFACIGG